jgi:hypothetical protein
MESLGRGTRRKKMSRHHPRFDCKERIDEFSGEKVWIKYTGYIDPSFAKEMLHETLERW